MAEGAGIAIIGGGPAGLMAAECLSAAGHAVTVYDAMPSLGRKFLLAGKSGLNLTHSEPHSALVARYGAAADWLAPALDGLTGSDMRAWAAGLGVETFVGSSGRVFPVAMKASPLLRAWLKRLDAHGVRLARRHRWTGFAADGALQFETPDGPVTIRPAATLLALGGASWPRLGSDAAWVTLLGEHGVRIAPLKPANCGFDCDWSADLVERFAGAPVKGVTACHDGKAIPGEFVITRTGVEGSPVYAHSAGLRDAIERSGAAVLQIDLTPGRSAERLAHALAKVGTRNSLSNRLRKAAALDGVKAALVREVAPDAGMLPPENLAALIKALPVLCLRSRPISEAISTAGGIARSALDNNFMLRALPGIFAAGEMLDWEAPTGGYLLTACMATGKAAADGMMLWMEGVRA